MPEGMVSQIGSLLYVRYGFGLPCVGGRRGLSVASSRQTPSVKCVEPEELSLLDVGQNPLTVLLVSQKEKVKGRYSQDFSTQAGWV